MYTGNENWNPSRIGFSSLISNFCLFDEIGQVQGIQSIFILKRGGDNNEF